jgi:hypothetical protein
MPCHAHAPASDPTQTGSESGDTECCPACDVYVGGDAPILSGLTAVALSASLLPVPAQEPRLGQATYRPPDRAGPSLARLNVPLLI